MPFVFLLFLAAAVIIFIRRQNRKVIVEAWLEASYLLKNQLENIKFHAAGTASGMPTLNGTVDGRRIDIAPFHHKEIGSSTTKMTGYRVQLTSPVKIPSAEFTRINNHFSKVEVDDRRIFCGTGGIENSATNIVTAVHKIATALRAADLARDAAQTLAAQPPAPVTQETEVILEATDIIEQPAEPEEKTTDAPAIEQPPELPTPSPLAAVKVEPAEPEDPPARPEPPIPTPELEPPAEPALTATARDLFANDRNHFEATQHYTATYHDREITGHGKLRKVTTFSNDRTFGRGPGVLAEVEISCPPLPANNEDETPPAHPSGPLLAIVALQLDEETAPSAAARNFRDRTGDRIDLVGTLVRCDPFEHKLYLTNGVID